MTNVPGSTLSREANHTMLLHAGPEIAVASTKAYTAQIVALAFLAKAVGEANNEKAKAFDLVHELSIVAQSIESTLSEKNWLMLKFVTSLKQHATPFTSDVVKTICSHGSQSQTQRDFLHPMWRFAAGELKHGTIALIEDGTPVWPSCQIQFLLTTLVEISRSGSSWC